MHDDFTSREPMSVSLFSHKTWSNMRAMREFESAMKVKHRKFVASRPEPVETPRNVRGWEVLDHSFTPQEQRHCMKLERQRRYGVATALPTLRWLRIGFASTFCQVCHARALSLSRSVLFGRLHDQVGGQA